MAELRVKGTGTLKLFENDNTSSVTIASPASLGGDRTVTVPDADVTLLTGWSTDSGTNDSLVPASASAGIYLGVAAATAANLLDDYEEGTWTPTFTSGGNTLSFTGGTETYTYTKIGNTCHLRFNIQDCTTSGTAATGDNRITIPFNGAANLRQPTTVISFYTSGGLRYTGGDFIMGEIGSSSSFIQLQEWTSSGYQNISSEPSTGSGTYFWFTVTYQTA